MPTTLGTGREVALTDANKRCAVTANAAAPARLKVLLLCDDWSGHAPTIHDGLRAFDGSRHAVYRMNPRGVRKPRILDLDEFDVVVIHWTLLCIHDHYLSPGWRRAIADYRGLKVQFIQDDYRWVNQIADRMRELGIHLLYSLAAWDKLDRLWTPERLPNVEKRSYLAGYVPEQYEKLPWKPLAERSIDVGYRGRVVPYWLGRLAQDKLRIGPDFLAHSQGRSLKCDIAWREEDRIYGDQWFKFLGSCRAVLGVESGSSIVDFDGSLQKTVDAYVAAHPQADFEEVFEKILAPFEGNLVLNVISPRVFEAISVGTALVMFPGEYSGIMEAERHYIPLARDFSNIDEVVARLHDDVYLEQLTRRAYAEIIASRLHVYQTLIDDFDDAVDRLAPSHAISREDYSPARRLKTQLLCGYRLAKWQQRIAVPLARCGRGVSLLRHRIRHAIHFLRHTAKRGLRAGRRLVAAVRGRPTLVAEPKSADKSSEPSRRRAA